MAEVADASPPPATTTGGGDRKRGRASPVLPPPPSGPPPPGPHKRRREEGGGGFDRRRLGPVGGGGHEQDDRRYGNGLGGVGGRGGDGRYPNRAPVFECVKLVKGIIVISCVEEREKTVTVNAVEVELTRCSGVLYKRLAFDVLHKVETREEAKKALRKIKDKQAMK